MELDPFVHNGNNKTSLEQTRPYMESERLPTSTFTRKTIWYTRVVESQYITEFNWTVFQTEQLTNNNWHGLLLI